MYLMLVWFLISYVIGLYLDLGCMRPNRTNPGYDVSVGNSFRSLDKGVVQLYTYLFKLISGYNRSDAVLRGPDWREPKAFELQDVDSSFLVKAGVKNGMPHTAQIGRTWYKNPDVNTDQW